MMLTPYDIACIESDVRNIIKMWNLRIEILDPVAPELQSNWNPILHEYSGAIEYVQYINVIAERKDTQDKLIDDLNIRDGAGAKDDGRLIFTISDTYMFPIDRIGLNCILLYDNSRWKIDSIKARIGETLILVSRVTGSNENWSNEPRAIINMFEDSGATW